MIQVLPLANRIKDLEVFWPSIAAYWESAGGVREIVPLLQERAIVSTAGIPTQGFIAYSHFQPVSFGWVERSTPHYGNLFVYSLHPEFRTLVPNEIVKAGYLNQVYVELVQFEDAPEYREALLAAGVSEFSRQRMGMELANFKPTVTKRDDVSLTFLKREDAESVGPVSALAHWVGQDYPGYSELEKPDERIMLEKKVFDGLYGTVIERGSLKASMDGKVVGSCLMVSVECWGYKEAAWVFDITVHPDYQGKGLGRYMIETAMMHLKQMGYPVIGLAVTDTNHAAKALYTTLGMVPVETFYEFTHSPKST
jgi:ribosomal protein S18 acetylase RimI-like enzyme